MKKEEKISLAECIWLFITGCIAGYIIETVWYFIKHGIWINKPGLLYGPFKPIYGLGFVLIVLIMKNFRDKKRSFKFFLGVIIGSGFEYICSLFQEYVFKTSTWNYSKFHLSLGSRLYLPYCLLWGIIAILCIDFLEPRIRKILNKVPNLFLKIVTVAVSFMMLINISLTYVAVMRYGERANNIVRDEHVFKTIDKIYNDTYMNKRFPKMVAVKKSEK